MIKASRPVYSSPPSRQSAALPPSEQARQHAACQALGDVLRKRDCEIRDLELQDSGSPLHIFECLPFNTSLVSLNIEHTRKLDDTSATFKPLEPQDYQYLVECLEQRSPQRPLELLYAPGNAFTVDQLDRLAHSGTAVIPTETPPPRPEAPAAPRAPDMLQLPLPPNVLTKTYLNTGGIALVLVHLIETHQSHIALTGTHVTLAGCIQLEILLSASADTVLSVDLRGAKVDRLDLLLKGLEMRTLPLDTLWIDAFVLNTDDHWIALVQLLMHQKIRELVINPEALTERQAIQKRNLQKMPELARRLALQGVKIWQGDRCIHPAEARPERPSSSKPPVMHSPVPAARPSDAILEDHALVECLRRRDSAALARHLSASNATLRWPYASMDWADASRVGYALCDQADCLLGLDLSACTYYEPAPSKWKLLPSDSTAISKLLHELDQRLAIKPSAHLQLLALNADSLRKSDWANLKALVKEGAILKLKFSGTNDKTRAKVERLLEAVLAAGSPTLISHD
ncbi:MAG: hypothetical protein IBJ04_16695 [Hydrogenophaga sp.]|uniref:hypothetical protein n=1 Tax=Hydrogenophaga sp. TaxID=1904254 RepID=UPI00257E9388|nr:hypothetical protein [Hydrogenophaga sp.]MBL0945957.1 hypothetical protein [Hydrogenophaga sp.]